MSRPPVSRAGASRHLTRDQIVPCGDRCAIWRLHAGCTHVPAFCDALSRTSGYDQLGLLAGIRNSSSFHIYCHVPVLGAKAGPDEQGDVELTAALVGTSADPNELNGAVSRLEACAPVETASWSLR